MTSSRKGRNIGRAWESAGLRIKGNILASKYAGMTYMVSFDYKADTEMPELRKKMHEIAKRAGCYLFLDYAGKTDWHEGKAIFVERKCLIVWKRKLEKTRDELFASFGYIQENENTMQAIKYILSALLYLSDGIIKAEDKEYFKSNERELRLHFDDIAIMQENEDYRKEANLRGEFMFQVLAGM